MCSIEASTSHTNEQEIAHWQARTDETEQLALELAMCVEAVNKINRLWQMGSDEDKQGLARSLFTDVLYDLDTRRIVGFKLKPWADRFLVLRTALYAQGEGQKNPHTADQGMYTDVLHTGFEPVFWP